METPSPKEMKTAKITIPIIFDRELVPRLREIPFFKFPWDKSVLSKKELIVV